MPLFGNKPNVSDEEVLKLLNKQVSTIDKNARFLIENLIRRSPNPKLAINNELVIKELAVYFDEFLRASYLKLLPPQCIPEYVSIVQRMKQGKATPMEEQRFVQNNIDNFTDVLLGLMDYFEQEGYMCYELRIKDGAVWVFNVGKTRGRLSPYRK